ncbi:Isochorismatase hydrolase [Pseudovirgaria hyperparasitica]|uniref:nicotinamidase n=1 Tax=Pseudovirgaria hyperparasitica TaxID=470096 RepID=A0A6A6VQ08_9PEZI|nr:Isochorismatase hydrolase [Pseudovirgaria hyperparasitica]KAF2752728.1 Isochorismatase hydrolase [Pseudovirgaria hyperparasitica]
MASSNAFVPALLVIDMQEDFCPPSGALQVSDGRTIIPLINTLLSSPSFALRIATKDDHPPNHISFASQHAPPNNVPFESTITITNPLNPSQTQVSRVWPDHCIQGTLGNQFVSELDVSNVQVVRKGQDARLEMYSVFCDPFGVAKSEAADLLRAKGVTHVYCVGLAADYCVKYTALDSVKEGFETYIIREGTKAVDQERLENCYAEIEKQGVRVVHIDSEEVRRVMA